ncbi:MAG: hypothetical protein ACKORI_05810, partial [Verrucomicrobiota bacterium]
MPEIAEPAEEIPPDGDAPYVARFAGRKRPHAWSPLLVGRFHAVLESGPTGRHTVVVPGVRAARRLPADGSADVLAAGRWTQLPGRGAAAQISQVLGAHALQVAPGPQGDEEVARPGVDRQRVRGGEPDRAG